MDREIRLTILVFVCCFSFLCYWTFNLMVVVTNSCFRFSEYWLVGNYFSPFWMFLIVFALIFIWGICEIVDAFFDGEDSIYAVSVNMVVFAFLMCVAASHYTLWQLMDFQDRKNTEIHFLFFSEEKERFNKEWRTEFFITSEYCKNHQKI